MTSVSYIYIDMVNENCEKHTPPTSTSIFFRVNTIFLKNAKQGRGAKKYM